MLDHCQLDFCLSKYTSNEGTMDVGLMGHPLRCEVSLQLQITRPLILFQIMRSSFLSYSTDSDWTRNEERVIELKLRKKASPRNLTSESILTQKLLEIINQGFKAQGRKYQVLPNLGTCRRELGGSNYEVSCTHAQFLLCRKGYHQNII